MPQVRNRSHDRTQRNYIVPEVKEHQQDGSSVLKLAAFVIVVLVGLFFYLIAVVPRTICVDNLSALNTTYPLSAPQHLPDGSIRYRIAIVTDRDLDSKSPNEKNTWIAYVKYGFLSFDAEKLKATITWDTEVVELKSTLSQGGRSMELSDFKIFDGHLHSVDDRTGIIYRHIGKSKVIPWVILADGDGSVAKGFKCEWIAIKDEHMYVGGLGKEWTSTTGTFENYNPMWVKRISRSGHVEHLDWVDNYKKLRGAAGIEYPGYMIHESGQWSDVHQQWFFMPRRAANEMYTEAEDEHRGTNYLLKANEDFTVVSAVHVTPLMNTRGFSAFQFVPGFDDQVIVALKSEEDRGNIRSYVTIFTLNNKIILEETELDLHYKFEGIEFV